MKNTQILLIMSSANKCLPELSYLKLLNHIFSHIYNNTVRLYQTFAGGAYNRYRKSSSYVIMPLSLSIQCYVLIAMFLSNVVLMYLIKYSSLHYKKFCKTIKQDLKHK